MPQFPDMRDQTVNLFRRQVQPVFPNIPVFHVVVKIDGIVIGINRKNTVVTAENAFEHKGQAAVRTGNRAVIQRMRKQRRIAFAVQAQQSMPEKRSRITHIGAGKNQSGAFGVNSGFKILIIFACDGRHQTGVKAQLRVQPGIAGRKQALRVIVTAVFSFDDLRFVRRHKKSAQISLQFFVRIGFAVGRQKKASESIVLSFDPKRL